MVLDNSSERAPMKRMLEIRRAQTIFWSGSRDSRSKRVRAKIVRRNADSSCREACAQGAIASRYFILGPDIPNFLDDFDYGSA